MIHYITGVPGHGKTLRCMWYLEQPEFAGRPVFSNIEGPGFTPENPTLPAGHSPLPADWRDCPDGCVVVIDEVQHRWPQRGPSKPVPDDVSALDTHRHRGIDFILMTQRPTGVDHHVRGLVGRHEHLRRKAGVQAAVIHRKDEAFDPKDKRELYEADSEVWRYPKNLYGKYKSSVEHTDTYKFKMPAKAKAYAVAIVLLLCFSVFLGFRTVSGFGDEPVEETASSESLESRVSGRIKASPASLGSTPGDCNVDSPPSNCARPRSPDYYFNEPDRTRVTGCFHQGDTCFCWARDSGKPIRDYTFCMNWMAES